MAIGLASAPLLPIVFGGVLRALAWTGLWGAPLPFLWLAVPAEIWAIAFGTFYLMTAPRRSGTINRANCMFVGGLAAVLFPPVLMLLYAGMAGGAGLSILAAMALPFSILAGLFLIPLGVLGGWVFWLVGVRPARAPTDGVARVFE